MPTIVLNGPVRLRGSVAVHGSKNAALPALAASLLTTAPLQLQNVPPLQDVQQMLAALEEIGVEIQTDPASSALTLSTASLLELEPNPERIRKMRASFLLLAPLLWRHGRVALPLPGGCTIGPRPVDLHLKGLAALGADVRQQPTTIRVSLPLGGLRGTEIALPYPSVGATEQLLLAAVRASGQTIIRGAAMEPEVVALLTLLRSMGAAIERDMDTLVIDGTPHLRGASHIIPPDRIEAGTFLLAAPATGGEFTVCGAPVSELDAVVEVLRTLGCCVSFSDSDISVAAPETIRSLRTEARPFPGFPTDLQPILVASLAAAEGESVVRDSVFPERFGYVSELNKLGADIIVHRSSAAIPGRRHLTGCAVTARDLRAGAALVIAGLSATGITTILEPHHIDRGYAALEAKFASLGATIERKP